MTALSTNNPLIFSSYQDFEQFASKLDDTEKAILRLTFSAIGSAGSKGWKTRRLKEFSHWLCDRRGLPHPSSGC